MDADIRKAERDGDVQRQFIHLIRSGQNQEAFALAQGGPIHTECTIEYHYSYSFRRNSGARHRTGLEETVDDLVPVVAENIRSSHITRGMEINEFPRGLRETRGSLIKVPVVILHGEVREWPSSDLLPLVICPTDELKDFLQRVTTIQNAPEEETDSEADADLSSLHGTTVYSVEYDTEMDGVVSALPRGCLACRRTDKPLVRDGLGGQEYCQKCLDDCHVWPG